MRALAKTDELPLTIAAHRLGIPYPIAYRRMFAGELSGRRIGTRWYVKLADVERFEAERSGMVAQPA